MKRFWVAIFSVLLLGLACNGTGGTIHNNSQECHIQNVTTICDGSIGKIKGTPSLDIELPVTMSTVQVSVRLQTGQGAVRVYVKTPDGEQAGAIASPGHPAVFTSPATTYSDSVSIYLEAQDEEASDLQYHVEVH